jgi:hypothetical protein
LTFGYGKLKKTVTEVRDSQKTEPMQNENLADDLLDGVAAIAAFTGWPERRVYYLAERGLLPVFKMGERKWCARKSTLRRHIDALEARAVAS